MYFNALANCWTCCLLSSHAKYLSLAYLSVCRYHLLLVIDQYYLQILKCICHWRSDTVIHFNWSFINFDSLFSFYCKECPLFWKELSTSTFLCTCIWFVPDSYMMNDSIYFHYNIQKQILIECDFGVVLPGDFSKVLSNIRLWIIHIFSMLAACNIDCMKIWLKRSTSLLDMISISLEHYIHIFKPSDTTAMTYMCWMSNCCWIMHHQYPLNNAYFPLWIHVVTIIYIVYERISLVIRKYYFEECFFQDEPSIFSNHCVSMKNPEIQRTS